MSYSFILLQTFMDLPWPRLDYRNDILTSKLLLGLITAFLSSSVFLGQGFVLL